MSTDASTVNPDLLWLELTLENRTRVFAFGPEDDVVVVVGSLLRADVRLDRAGVAPVHFQLERVADALLLTPVYGRDVRLNGERLREPSLLPVDCLVEFAGTHLRALVLETRPPSGEFDDDRTTIDHRLAALCLPGEEDTTIVAVPATGGAPRSPRSRTGDLVAACLLLLCALLAGAGVWCIATDTHDGLRDAAQRQCE